MAKTDWKLISQRFALARLESGCSLTEFCSEQDINVRTAQRNISTSDIDKKYGKHKTPKGKRSLKKLREALQDKGSDASEVSEDTHETRKTPDCRKHEEGEDRSLRRNCVNESPDALCGAPLDGNGVNKFCTRPAGWGIKGVNTGRCKNHLAKPVSKSGFQSGNQLARKHGAYSKFIDPEALEAVQDIHPLDVDSTIQLVQAQNYLVAQYQQSSMDNAKAMLAEASQMEDPEQKFEALNTAQALMSQALFSPMGAINELVKAQAKLVDTRIKGMEFLHNQHPLSKSEQLELTHKVMMEADRDPKIKAIDIARRLASMGIDVPAAILNEQKIELADQVEEPAQEMEPLDNDKLEAQYQAIQAKLAEEAEEQASRAKIFEEEDARREREKMQ